MGLELGIIDVMIPLVEKPWKEFLY